MTTIEKHALNRALLARQLLSTRASLTAVDAIEQLAGMQAQEPVAPYVGLWSRVDGFAPGDLAALLIDRQVVRLTLMRGTVHLVTAHDCMALRPVVQAMLERRFAHSAYSKQLVGIDLGAVVDRARAYVEAAPRTNAEIRAHLLEQWPDADGPALVAAARFILPLVQLPPRGVWGEGGIVRSTTAQVWLRREIDSDASVDELVVRYLRAFGPATVDDAQNWSGLTRLRAAFERLRSQLVTFSDARGKELFDLPDAPRPDADAAVPPRFLPAFDNLLLGHADRSRVIPPEHAPWVTEHLGMPMVLLDGFVAGKWKVERAGGTATLAIHLLDRLRRSDRGALRAEGERLLRFTDPEASRYAVEITDR